MTKRQKLWQQRGLFIFYLPTYSLHLKLFEFGGNGLAEIEIRMAQGARLQFQRTFAIFGQASVMGIWKKSENNLLRL